LERDQSEKKQSACAILSMQDQQIHDLVLKLLLEYPSTYDNDTSSSNSNNNNNNSKDGPLPGQTLVVARSKEDLEAWGQAFREGSAYSVLDHAALPLKDRKSPTTADKASRFDVVLTTFDALKANDVTVTLNEQGHTVYKKETTADGWFTSKSASQSVAAAPSADDDSDEDDDQQQPSPQVTKNKQYSVLHRLSWRRVVFCDILGRKCYLAKAGTARVQAATALGAQRR